MPGPGDGWRCDVADRFVFVEPTSRGLMRVCVLDSVATVNVGVCTPVLELTFFVGCRTGDRRIRQPCAVLVMDMKRGESRWWQRRVGIARRLGPPVLIVMNRIVGLMSR